MSKEAFRWAKKNQKKRKKMKKRRKRKKRKILSKTTYALAVIRAKG